jgi:hypothetical protein
MRRVTRAGKYKKNFTRDLPSEWRQKKTAWGEPIKALPPAKRIALKIRGQIPWRNPNLFKTRKEASEFIRQREKAGWNGHGYIKKRENGYEVVWRYFPELTTNPNPTIRLTLKRLPATNEWKVCWIEDGKLNEAKSYYTDDKKDAMDTMKVMQKQYKNNPRLDSWDKMERVRDHELHRMSTMSTEALYTRISKVTRPEKLRMFIQLAREHGKVELAREAQKRLRELGYRLNYKKNPILETVLASMAAGAASGATFYGISRAMGRPAHNPRRYRRNPMMELVKRKDGFHIIDNHGESWAYFNKKSEAYKWAKDMNVVLTDKTVEHNPASGNLKFPFICGICGTSTPKKGFAGFARTTLQGRKTVRPICVFCARRAGWKGVEQNPQKRFIKNPLTKQEISELESLRDTFLEELDGIDRSRPDELRRSYYLRGQATAINNVINTYEGSINTQEEITGRKWGVIKESKTNPRRRRRMMTNPRRIRGLPQIRAAELIAGLSPGFLYVVREVIAKNKPGVYDRYQLWPMDVGVEVRDIKTHKIIFLIPYRLAHRVDDIIEDIEERYRYGKPKVVYQKALLHDYKSELEPPIYEYEPIKTKYGMLKKHMPKTVKPEKQVKNIILIRTSTWAAGYSWLPGNFYRGWIGTEKGLKYSIPFRFMEQVYEWLESKGIILPQEITRQRAIIVPSAPVLAKQPPTPPREPPTPKTSAEEAYEYGIEKNPGGMPSQKDVEVAVRKAEEFHDAPPKRMIKIRLPKLNDVLVKIGLWPSVPYFSGKWGKKNQEFAGKKGQLYLHEWEDSEAQRRKRLVVYSPDKKNPNKGWIVAWGRGRLTPHGIEDLKKD